MNCDAAPSTTTRTRPPPGRGTAQENARHGAGQGRKMDQETSRAGHVVDLPSVTLLTGRDWPAQWPLHLVPAIHSQPFTRWEEANGFVPATRWSVRQLRPICLPRGQSSSSGTVRQDWPRSQALDDERHALMSRKFVGGTDASRRESGSGQEPAGGRPAPKGIG